MHLTHIAVENYQRIRSIDMELRAPVLFVVGPNEAGKTSLADAIYHAFNGVARRVALKKDFADIVHDGEKRGSAIVQWSDASGTGSTGVTIPSDKRTSDMEIPPIFSLLLDSHAFSRLPAGERRSLVFSLGRVRVTGATIRLKLLEKGADAKKVEKVAPLLLSGFEAAAADVKTQASEARGSWKAITGEAYGSKKAPAWKAPKPEWSPEKLAQAAADLTAADQAVLDATTTHTELAAAKRTHNEQHQRKETLRETAAGLARAEAKLAVDEESLKEWKDRVEEAAAKASGTPVQPTLNCPECGAVLDTKDGKLVSHVPPSKTPDAKSVALLPSYRESLEKCESFVKNDKAALERARNAKAALEEMEKNTPELPAQSAIDDAVTAVRTATAARDNARTALQTEEQAKRQAEAADANTAKALGFHQDVEQWEAIGGWLAPDGIQSELIKAALDPINARLATTCQITGWDPITLDADMVIRMNQRPYALCSASARWRADAAMTEAIAFVSGQGVFLLDEVDVLDSANRIALLTWIHKTAVAGEINTAILLGTFKTRPTCPPTFQVCWISEGVLESLQEERLAA